MAVLPNSPALYLRGWRVFSGVMDLAVSGEAEALCAAEKNGMPWYTGCARRASTDGRSTYIYRYLNRGLEH